MCFFRYGAVTLAMTVAMLAMTVAVMPVVVAVHVFVADGPVLVRVTVGLRGVQPNADKHQHARNGQ